ncbi:aminotransferase class I/II-fold pyridoxal phosphate-dependent enzyme [Labilibaculum sp. DW002]|uniref:Aminotransferase class I/II-fold pyridoxal phosphate-dependent enzyme n=1 Tax=Paralabilibaculum antarcticum TaxID=2912572 RepID=A0ABT5VP60_9BACT|nr:DegT/DnrJ/EryC1/StrS family aminotransferase [Labilibaculum sp. DW002]MDE5417219.1 aminotransferase class I/II-fold pyridoxal phosphate-dependent enzyme [Labilibaculum sp. DW002]
MNSKIWLSSPHMGGNEMKYVQEAYDTNWVAPLGPNVNGFEEDLQNYTGAKHASALSAGTAAIHLSLILLGVKAGDEVIASSFTFSATVNPISYLGAIPILIDSEKDTWNMCPNQLEKAITDRIAKGNKPKAIIVVYLYGMPAKVEELLVVANKYDIPLIEDAAEALGSKYKGKSMGTFGKFGILSFNGNKIITTSAGGALISDDKELIEKSRFLATQARDNAPHYQHSQIGYNYRMSNIVAGIGRGQMEVLDERVAQRRANFKFYKELFANIDGVSLLEEPNEDYFSNYWLTSILVDSSKTGGISREDIRLELEKENIECRPLWKPMHMQPIFADCPYYGNGTSERLFEDGLCLPSGSNMIDEERDRIKAAIIKLFRK